MVGTEGKLLTLQAWRDYPPQWGVWLERYDFLSCWMNGIGYIYPYFLNKPIYYCTVSPTTPGLRATLSRLGEGKGFLAFGWSHSSNTCIIVTFRDDVGIVPYG